MLLHKLFCESNSLFPENSKMQCGDSKVIFVTVNDFKLPHNPFYLFIYFSNTPTQTTDNLHMANMYI